MVASTLALLVGGAIFAAGTTTVVVSLTPDGNINEGVGTVTFRVRLTDAIADGQVQVRVRSVDGTGANGALAGSDFTALNQVVTFTPSGAQFADLTLTVNDDTVDELNETFTVLAELVSNTSSSVVLFGAPYTAVIEDNDSPTLTSIVGPGTVSEAVGNASFVITMAQSSPQPVSFNWTLVPVAPDGVTLPPAAGADVALASGVWTIPANTPAGPSTFTIGIVDDTTTENDEQFRVDITSVSNVANPLVATGADPLVTIDDNDGVPTVSTNTGLTVLEAGSGTISQANLEATDAEQTPAQLTFRVVTAPANGTLFRNAVALAANGTFTQADVNSSLISYTHNGGETTTDSLVFTVTDGNTTTTNQTFTITITPVNDAPSFTKGADVTVNEDSGAYSQPWATGISAGTGEITQTVSFEITGNDNAALFSAGPAVAANGTLTFTPAANASGVANLQVRIRDDGGTANGGVDASASQSFVITVTGVNDAPSFTKGADVTVNEDSGAYSQPWATGISAGPANESAQTVSFEITANDNPTLFSAGPAVAANGTLSFTPAANAFGVANLQVRIRDNGGTANGGVDASATQSFVITLADINDAPSFTKGPDVTVNEDSGAYSQPWATGISAGTGEITQTVSFEITANDNPTLFSAGPAVAANGTLSFTPAANASGVANLQVRIRDDGGTARGGVDASATQSFVITVTSINDAPSFTKGADVTVNEDSGAYSQPWATAISAGPGETGQTVSFEITANDNAALFSVAPAVASDGTLTFTPAANAFGVANVQVRIVDNGGTANGGVNASAAQSFVITVTGVNDAPSFTKGADVTVAEDSGAYSQPWATAISAGPGETGQTVSFEITGNDNAALFSAGPAVAANGTLTFTPAAGASGVANVQVRAVDDGGTANSGSDTSASQSFVITVTSVNDAPSFTKGADVTVLEDAAAYTEAGWATAISAGPGDTGQTVTFEITANNNTALFSVQPAVASDGTLTFTPAANAFGVANVQVRAVDDGGTANGGVNASAAQSFVITVTGVNDAPSFTKGADVTVSEDSGAYSQPWATAISAGPGETGQTVTFEITANDNAALFSAGPAVAANGTLTFTPAANAFGVANVQVRIVDNGGTTNSGSDTSVSQSFVITVTSANDLPTATDDTYNTNEETPLIVLPAAGVLSNDNDIETPQASLVVSEVNGSAANVGVVITTANGGLLQVGADGSFSYTPATDFTSADTFTYTARDTDGGERSATVTINVANTNDAPTLGANTGITVAEGAAATIAAAQLTYNDIDNTAAQLTYTITDATDVGTLRRGATALGVGGTFTQADINSGSISYTHNGSESPTTDSFGFSLSDGTAPPISGTFTITITPVNDRPVVDANGAAAGINYTVPSSYVEQAAPIAIVDPALTASDADSASLQRVTVSIGAPVTADETLAVDTTAATTAGITPSYNSTTGVLTLTGPASPANFQTVLRTLTYVSSAENPPASRTITVLATDAETPSADADPAAVITLNIQVVNDPPTIGASSLTLNEGATVNVTPANLRADDPDTAAADLRFTVTAPPTRGALRRDGVDLAVNSFFTQAQIDSGSLSYVHSGGENTSDSVGFRVSDGVNPAVNGTLVITIVAVNDAPVITLTLGPTPYLAGDPAVVIDAGATISDADSLDFDGGELRVALTGGGLGDTLAIRNEGSGPGQVGVSGTTVSVGGVAIGTLSGGTGGQPLVVSLNSSANPTTMQAVVRTITFANAIASPVGGPRTATFTLRDGDGQTSAPVGKVIALNRAPTANDDSLRAFINDNAAPLAVLANDSDPDGDPLTITAVTQPTNGTVAITGGGSGVAYTPTADYTGSDSFTYTISDGRGGVDTATVNLTVTRVMIMLPLLSVPPQPDLTVSFQVNPASPQAGKSASIAVTVTNTGTAPASDFWVDFYIEPTRAPQVNEPWNELCKLENCFGLAWYYDGTLAPGQSVVLNSRPQSTANPNGFYREASNWPGFFDNGTTRLYALVDSWNRDASGAIRNPTGAVLEIDETNNLASQSIVVTPGVLPPLATTEDAAEPRRYQR